jgi:hypothetical protein
LGTCGDKKHPPLLNPNAADGVIASATAGQQPMPSSWVSTHRQHLVHHVTVCCHVACYSNLPCARHLGAHPERWLAPQLWAAAAACRDHSPPPPPNTTCLPPSRGVPSTGQSTSPALSTTPLVLYIFYITVASTLPRKPYQRYIKDHTLFWLNLGRSRPTAAVGSF